MSTNPKLINAAADVIQVSMARGNREALSFAFDLDAAGLLQAPETGEELDQLRARVAELTDRARRVAVSHEHFIQDHADPGTEALAAQYELINWLSASEPDTDLPLSPIENVLRIILAQLDQYDENVTPSELRAAIAEALPRDDMSDRRRRIYVDAHGDGWIDESVDKDGSKWVVQLSSMAAGGSEPKHAVAKRTGSLREIGRCW